ncbi:hypothetical protein [Alloyangia mangrovi]|uniref:hypothetical protein n=1 Tax=Alloyangia mangrovi TaxID=1779329 RepID=UPI0021A71BB0|nr:hypothetical protein [Alloyangia mangrovi]
MGAWNLERCLFPEASAAHAGDCDLLLLSEMDHGMARTKQRNTTAVMAAEQGMVYAYAVEFLELGLGSPIELQFCDEDRNALGYHGNGLMARSALRAPFALRLWGRRQWFFDDEQPRLGERIAVGARIETSGGAVHRRFDPSRKRLRPRAPAEAGGRPDRRAGRRVPRPAGADRRRSQHRQSCGWRLAGRGAL